jgi:hypothetical protein
MRGSFFELPYHKVGIQCTVVKYTKEVPMKLSNSDREDLKRIHDEIMDFANSIISEIKKSEEVDEETESILRGLVLPFQKELIDLFSEESINSFENLEEMEPKAEDIMKRMMSHLDSFEKSL